MIELFVAFLIGTVFNFTVGYFAEKFTEGEPSVSSIIGILITFIITSIILGFGLDAIFKII